MYERSYSSSVMLRGSDAGGMFNLQQVKAATAATVPTALPYKSGGLTLMMHITSGMIHHLGASLNEQHIHCWFTICHGI